jgi:hypothetical protein
VWNIRELLVTQLPATAEREITYVQDPARLREADAISPLIDGLARSEAHNMPRTDGKSLGQFGVNLVPALCKQFDKRLRKATDEQREAAFEAVETAAAVGYVVFITLEPEPGLRLRPDPDMRAIWNYAAHNFRTIDPLRRLGIEQSAARFMYELAEVAFMALLQDADLVGRRKNRVQVLARYYAHAALLMRLGQADFVDVQGELLSPDGGLMPDFWPYDEYVLGPG